MTERIIFRPLRSWPYPSTPSFRRQKWPGAVTVSKALDSLRQQLRLLGCDATAYIEADVEERHIRQDGQLYASARAATPAVIVYARHRRLGNLLWANDQYLTYDQNVRAIAMTIQNLRSIDRYGCVRDNEQFTGFKAIPAQASNTMTRDAAIVVLSRHSGAPVLDTSPEGLKRAYRSARARVHPDVNNGDQSAWDAVEAAAQALGVS